MSAAARAADAAPVGWRTRLIPVVVACPLFLQNLDTSVMATALPSIARALDEYRVDGLKTSVSFHRNVMRHPAFRAGDLHTGFVAEHPELVGAGDDVWLDEIAVIAAAIAHFRNAEAISARGLASTASSGGSTWRWGGRRGWRS